MSDHGSNEPGPQVQAPWKSYRFLWLSLAVLGLSVFALRTASAAQAQGADPAAAQDLWKTIGIWCAAFMTLGILSFLYKDNPFYKVCESILIGVSAAYWMVNGFWSTLVPNLFAKLAPATVREIALPDLPVSATPGTDMALAFVPLVLGFMLLWRLAPRGGWIAVWPLAFIIGTTAGMRLVHMVAGERSFPVVEASATGYGYSLSTPEHEALQALAAEIVTAARLSQRLRAYLVEGLKTGTAVAGKLRISCSIPLSSR
jgi:hypothetical protein